jgi:hypothetical protein
LISPAQNLPAQAVSGSQRYAHADFAERLTRNWQDNRRKSRGRGIERDLLTDRFDRATDASSGLAVEGVGYEIGQAVAADNLALGRTVIADYVNPWPLTRDAWQQVG